MRRGEVVMSKTMMKKEGDRYCSMPVTVIETEVSSNETNQTDLVSNATVKESLGN